MQIQRTKDFCVVIRKELHGRLKAGPVYVNTMAIKEFFDQQLHLSPAQQLEFFTNVKLDVTSRIPEEIDIYYREESLTETNPRANQELVDFVQQLSDFTDNLSNNSGNTDKERS